VQMLVVTVGGVTFDDTRCRRAAALVGAAGGCILSTSSTLATGSGGGWSATLANFAPAGVATATGELAAIGGFAGGSAISNSLSRTVVPGHAEVNTLATNMYGGGYNITNLGQVGATSDIATTGGSVKGPQVVPTTTVVVGGACAPQNAIGALATGQSVYCSSGLVWTKPTASANFMLWF